MNLLSLPDGRIVNLEHLTFAERAGEYLALHFARRVWRTSPANAP